MGKTNKNAIAMSLDLYIKSENRMRERHFFVRLHHQNKQYEPILSSQNHRYHSPRADGYVLRTKVLVRGRDPCHWTVRQLGDAHRFPTGYLLGDYDKYQYS